MKSRSELIALVGEEHLNYYKPYRGDKFYVILNTPKMARAVVEGTLTEKEVREIFEVFESVVEGEFQMKKYMRGFVKGIRESFDVQLKMRNDYAERIKAYNSQFQSNKITDTSFTLKEGETAEPIKISKRRRKKKTVQKPKKTIISKQYSSQDKS